MALERYADLKVVGQTYELTVKLPDQGKVTGASSTRLVGLR